MNRSLLIIYFVVVAIVGYAFFKFSSSSNVPQFGSESINRSATPKATKDKVDNIFSQFDWDYKTYRQIRKSPSSRDSQEIVEQRAKYKKLRLELVGLGQEAYPAILRYIVSPDKGQSYFASDYARDLHEAAVEPLMVQLGQQGLNKRDKRTYERMITSAASYDFEPLVKFLSSGNMKERSIAAKILADRAKNVMQSSRRYSYRLRDYSSRRKRKNILPLADREKLLALYQSEQDENIKSNLAIVIGAYGEDNEDIKADLIKYFNNEKSEVVKQSWAQALGYLARHETVSGAKDTLKPLTDTLLESKSNSLRHSILLTLAMSSDKLNEDSIKALEQTTKDNIESISLGALETLTRASQYRKDCIPFVITSLNSNDRDTVKSAIRVIPSITDGIEEILPKLFELAKTKNYGSYACSSIGSLPPKYQDQSVKVLKEILAGDGWNRRSAISALDRIGPKAKAALPELKKIASGSNRSLSGRAKRLVTKLESGNY